MGLHLILGGAASGKSAYAEARAQEAAARRKQSGRAGGKLYYLAAMYADGSQESRQRIAKHRAARAGKGFLTLECPCNLGALSAPVIPAAAESPALPPARRNHHFQKEDVLLLEDLSNLLANEIYLPEGRLSGGLLGDPRERSAWKSPLEQAILEPILALSHQAGECFLVGNEVFSDGLVYAGETERFREMLAYLHRSLAGFSETVTELCCGIPLPGKGAHLETGIYAQEPCGQGAEEEAEEKTHKLSGKGASRLVFIYGGKYQGKMDFALKHFPHARIASDYQDIVREQLSARLDPLENAERFLREKLLPQKLLPEKQLRERQLQKKPLPEGDLPGAQETLVILSEEIGCGIVPLDRAERAYREANGRVNCFFAEKAGEVYRVSAGLAQRIK